MFGTGGASARGGSRGGRGWRDWGRKGMDVGRVICGWTGCGGLCFVKGWGLGLGIVRMSAIQRAVWR